MHREKAAFDKLAVRVVIVGHSSHRYAQTFVQETGVTFPVYVDKDRAVYQALEFRRPVLTFFSTKSIRRSIEARKAGFTQPGVHGDPFQLGGVILRMPDGETPYRYASRFAGDHPKIDDLLRAIQNATAKK